MFKRRQTSTRATCWEVVIVTRGRLQTSEVVPEFWEPCSHAFCEEPYVTDSSKETLPEGAVRVVLGCQSSTV